MKPSYVLIIVLIFSIACKKEKAVPITKEAIAGTYKLQKVTFKTNSDEQDRTDDFVTDCAKDDLYIFEADGDYTYDDAGVQCGGGDETGIWSLNSSTVISIDGTTFDLDSFNGSVLVVAQTYNDGGITGKLKTHLKKQ